MKKLSNTDSELKKRVAYKKSVQKKRVKKLQSNKSKHRFCAVSNLVHGVSQIYNNEDQWSRLEIKLNVHNRKSIHHHHHLLKK